MALQGLADAHQRHPDAAYLGCAQPPQQLCPAEGEQPPAQIAGQFVDVGQRDQETDGHAFIFGDADQVFKDNGLQLFADKRDFGRGERHKTPVGRPGIVENIEDQRGFLGKARLVDLAGLQLGVALAGRDDALNDLGERPVDAQAPGVQILDASIAARFDMADIIRQMMPHHHRRRRVKAFDQQPGFIPDRDAERTLRHRHAFAAQPVFGGFEQQIGDIDIIDAFEQSPMAGRRADMLEHQSVNLRRNAADDFASAPRQPHLRAAVFEPGVALDAADQRQRLAAQRRHEVGVIGIEPIGQIDEPFAVGGGFDGLDGQAGHAHQPTVKALEITRKPLVARVA